MPVLVVATAAALLAFFFLDRDEEHEDPPKPDPTAGRRQAEQACQDFDRVITLIEQNARADRVFDRLDRAKEAARAAALADPPQWQGLSGGLGGIEVGLRNNDPEAAELSSRVVRAVCAPLRASPSPGP